MKIFNSILLILTLTLFGCGDTSENAETKFVTCSEAAENEGKCLRYMDRDIYFANSVNGEKLQIHVDKIKEALRDIELSTALGEGYFNFKQTDPQLLNPNLEVELSENEIKSFILIWDDVKFNEFILENEIGSIPDPNSLAVINAANKRKFYIIVRESCLGKSSSCSDELGEGITTSGFRALVARQLGLLVGMRTKSCSVGEKFDTMCSELPNDDQWEGVSKDRWVSSFNNALETIDNNPNFYDEFTEENPDTEEDE